MLFISHFLNNACYSQGKQGRENVWSGEEPLAKPPQDQVWVLMMPLLEFCGRVVLDTRQSPELLAVRA